jgi:ferredoxin
MTENTDQALKFTIDTDLCVGHGRCYTLASQWFDADDIGYGEVKDGVLIAADQRAAAEDVAAACPEGAIRLETA